MIIKIIFKEKFLMDICDFLKYFILMLDFVFYVEMGYCLINFFMVFLC